MAKKKSTKHKVTKPQEFSSSPFKNLKGLSAFSEPQPQPRDSVSKKTTDIGPSTASPHNDHSFADEMDFLGVEPLAERVVEVTAPAKVVKENSPQALRPSREEREEAVFLDAIGAVDKVFKDEWPEEEPLKQAVPRRMKQVERGQLKPEAELDLHGLTVDEASAKIRFFLRDAIYQGFQTVLVITGKGLHSNDGPVLRKAVEALLTHLREQVIEWGVAPQRYGGGGALIIFLRRPAS